MNMDFENDFENEFESDEEVEEAIDGFINYIKETIDAQTEDVVSVTNPKKVQAIEYTYKVLKYLTKGTGAKVSYALNEPFNCMGSVSVVGKELTFSKPEWFMAAIRLASNFNVYPKTNGTVQMDFTFHGLTITLE